MPSNPLRVIFLKLSTMPPALMLLIIIGLAVAVTMMVTGKVSKEEQRLTAGKPQASSAFVVMSDEAIPARTEISRTMIVQRRAAETEIWQDAITSKSNAIGRVTDKLIPAHTQIRESDLR
ncbi:MAG: hypothetical protein IT342_23140 [Candidatus Melainabacteria bacterium]|nr:hypothetical protein [Candidatus Melainabacteria bacterium]